MVNLKFPSQVLANHLILIARVSRVVPFSAFIFHSYGQSMMLVGSDPSSYNTRCGSIIVSIRFSAII
jgi:hypothetical protein